MVESGRIDQIVACILEAVTLLNKRLPQPVEVELRERAPLFGTEGGLDSISLVSLIADVEELIDERFGQCIVLASERAFSRTRSPFRNVFELAHYIGELLEEKQCGTKSH